MEILTLARDRDRDGAIELWEVTRDGLALEVASGVDGKGLRTSRRLFATGHALEAWLREEITIRLNKGFQIRDQPTVEPVAKRGPKTDRDWLIVAAPAPSRELPLTRVGGRPVAPPGVAWRRCNTCREPLRFIFQLRLKDTGAAELGDGLLLVWQCATAVCDTSRPDGGATRAIIVDADALEQVQVLPPPSHGGDIAVELPRVEGVLFVGIERPLRRLDDTADPYDIARADRRNVLGMMSKRPTWAQDAETMACPGCRGRLRPVLQLEAHAGGGISKQGVGYAQMCPRCRMAAWMWRGAAPLAEVAAEITAEP